MHTNAKPVTSAASSTDSTVRLIRVSEVKAMTGLSRSYIYELASREVFPRSVSLVPGGTSRAWVEAEVRQWIDDRLAARNVGDAK